jgi:tetratricopeptide (TPR) repeat protein
VRASALERRWVDPLILRARVARAQYLSLTLVDPVPGQPPGSAGQLQMAKDRISVGLRHVAQALDVEPQHPEASTLEGYFLFSRWLVNGQPIASQDFVDAEANLREVVRNNPDQPLAWVILSRVYRTRGDTTAADAAAQRAFAADPFLWEGRRAIVDLMNQHVERGRITEARALCESARVNYSDDLQLAECRLMIMSWSARHRDSVAAAWRELAAIERRGIPGFATNWTLRRMYVAAVASRSGLPDSATAIIARAYANRGVNRADSTYAAIAEAWVYVLSGNKVRALRLVDSIVKNTAGQRDRIATHPFFTALRGDTGFVRIVGKGGS